jgi:DNA polymerase-3 subunit delta
MLIKSLDELENELKDGVIRPIYLLTGPEEYLRRKAEERIAGCVLAAEARAFNLSEYSLDSDAIDDVLQAAETFPLCAPYRLVIARELGSLPQDKEQALLEYLQRPSKKSVLVLVAEKVDNRKTFFRHIKEKHCVADFESPRPAVFARWAGQLLRERGYRLSQGAMDKLVALAGSDFQTLVGEIEKLTLYAGDDKNIPDTVLDELVRESREHTAFELTDAMGRRDAATALRLLNNLLGAGEAPLKILGAIVWNFRNVLMVQEQLALGKTKAQILAALQINPYSLEKALTQARGLDNLSVRRLYDRLAAVDLQIKSSGYDERMLIERLLCSL